MSKPDDVTREFAYAVWDSCLCLNTQRAARALSRRFDDALRPVGLTSGQFSLLMTLARHEPQPMRNVTFLLGMDRTTLTANLKPLQRRGLLKVTVDKEDRRGRLIALTAAGRALLAEAAPIWKRAHAAAQKLVTHSSPDALRADLRALSA